MINVAIVDDHAIVRTGLRQYLGEQSDLAVVGEAASGNEALDLVRAGGIDVLIMDISMPGQNGIDALAHIHARAPELPILILSAYPSEHYATDLLRRGASSYLNKECEPEEILTAVRALARGKRYISSDVAELLADQLQPDADLPAHKTLSDREFQVFLRLARGETVGAIADALALSVKTISTYRTRVLEKMQLGSNSDLTYYALKHQLID
ncbi:MAG: response regulator transcription factor [Spongiibacteraceae bacterium]